MSLKNCEKFDGRRDWKITFNKKLGEEVNKANRPKNRASAVARPQTKSRRGKKSETPVSESPELDDEEQDDSDGDDEQVSHLHS